jgi:kelch-like protein 1/4/5
MMDELTRSFSSASSISNPLNRSISSPRLFNADQVGSTGSSASPTGGQDESFTDTKHPNQLMNRVQKYAKTGLLTDVTLVCGQVEIPAHKIILVSASDYFSAMFTGGMVEAANPRVEIHGIDSQVLPLLVDFCYTGKIDLHEDTVEALMTAACLLQLPTVRDACSAFFRKLLHPSNCVGIRLFADAQCCLNLRDAAKIYMEDNFQEVIKNQEFLLLPVTEVVNILSSDDLNVPSEEIIFQAFMDWINYDFANRKADAARLLACIRLPLLSPQFIADNIENQPVLKNDSECHHLILEAMKYHLLPERRSQLQSSRTCPRKATVGYLYAVGGMDTNKGATSIERYDMRTNTWSQFASMSGRRLQFGVAVLNGKLFVVGGRDGLKTLNTAECYDPVERMWISLPPMITHRHGLGVTVLGGPLYAVGGHDGWSFLNTVERFDPATKQWSHVAPMSTQRSTAGVAVLNDRLFAVGGRDGSSCLRSVEAYSPHTNKWNFVANMCRRRGGVGVGVLNGLLYAVGGHDSPAVSNPNQSRMTCVERYDPLTDEWTLVASLSTGRDAIGVCILGEKLFAVGGYDGSCYLSLVESYDPSENTWKQMGSLNTGRGGACVVVVQKEELDPQNNAPN